jgi:hypothetical protein
MLHIIIINKYCIFSRGRPIFYLMYIMEGILNFFEIRQTVILPTGHKYIHLGKRKPSF